MTTPKPGAYRAIFIRALELLREECDETISVTAKQSTATDLCVTEAEAPELKAHIEHYLTCLHNTDYKFGIQIGGGSNHPNNGSLFLRS